MCVCCLSLCGMPFDHPIRLRAIVITESATFEALVLLSPGQSDPPGMDRVIDVAPLRALPGLDYFTRRRVVRAKCSQRANKGWWSCRGGG